MPGLVLHAALIVLAQKAHATKVPLRPLNSEEGAVTRHGPAMDEETKPKVRWFVTGAVVTQPQQLAFATSKQSDGIIACCHLLKVDADGELNASSFWKNPLASNFSALQNAGKQVVVDIGGDETACKSGSFLDKCAMWENREKLAADIASFAQRYSIDGFTLGMFRCAPTCHLYVLCMTSGACMLYVYPHRLICCHWIAVSTLLFSCCCIYCYVLLCSLLSCSLLLCCFELNKMNRAQCRLGVLPVIRLPLVEPHLGIHRG